ncbi:O-antigen ligase family protein [Lapidilactobacillus bayanensis]|uniref:O-antigen ligase family protein n=1 Tax=Lapidilactobacillus bayanensis TaxID=2485998 RepID=UPI000F7791CF|nr:O-antigen ligase family protein [Lapidilactobacillus bayanensis]
MRIRKTNLLLTDQPAPPVQLLLVLWGIGLATSRVIFGLNLSLTTVFLPILLLVIFLSYGRKIKFDGMDLFLGFIGVYSLVVSTMLIPILVPGGHVDTDVVVKYLITIIYFFIAQQLPSSAIKTIFKVFVYFNVIIAVIGIVGALTGASGFLSFMYMPDSERFFGLMNDPNYFSLIQAVSVCIVIAAEIKFRHPFVLNVLLIISMLLSGSKTAMIVAAALVAIIFIKWAVNHLSTLYRFCLFLLPVICLGILLYITKQLWFPAVQDWGNGLLDQSPIIQRLMELFEPDAFNSSGSSRTGAWETGIRIIQAVHGLGLGMTDYLVASQSLFDVPVLSHNTFLQLMAQWGIGLTVIFFVWLAVQMFQSLRLQKLFARTLLLVIVVILIYFVALSLNNSALVWFVFGMLFSQREDSSSKCLN